MTERHFSFSAPALTPLRCCVGGGAALRSRVAGRMDGVQSVCGPVSRCARCSAGPERVRWWDDGGGWGARIRSSTALRFDLCPCAFGSVRGVPEGGI